MIKKEITKNELREILLQKNSGELMSVIIAILLSYKKDLIKYLVDTIIAFADISKEKLEREIASNLRLDIKIIDDVQKETKKTKTKTT